MTTLEARITPKSSLRWTAADDKYLQDLFAADEPNHQEKPVYDQAHLDELIAKEVRAAELAPSDKYMQDIIEQELYDIDHDEAIQLNTLYDAQTEAKGMDAQRDERFQNARARYHESKHNLLTNLNTYKPFNWRAFREKAAAIAILVAAPILGSATFDTPKPEVKLEAIAKEEQLYSALQQGFLKTWPCVSRHGHGSAFNSIAGKRKLGAGEVGSKNHKGVDCDAELYDRIISPDDGVVVRTEGNVIDVETKRGLKHRFRHVQPLVKVGDYVNERDTLGMITNNSLRFSIDSLTGSYAVHAEWEPIPIGAPFKNVIGETIQPICLEIAPNRQALLANSSEKKNSGFRFIPGKDKYEKTANQCDDFFKRVAYATEQ